MHSSSWDHSSRLIPTRYDQEFWRPSTRWEVSPFTRDISPFTRDVSYVSHAPPPPPEYHSSLATYQAPPSRDRSVTEFEREMRRMNDEMGKMFNSLQKAQPVSNVDDWRLTENFRMENPIQTFADGTRKFHLQFDMRQFKPEEIQVKTSGNTLTVGAKHDEKDPNKSVFREYNRSYVIPKGVNPEMLVSKLSTGGILTIEAPLPALEGPREKMIPIKHN